MTKLKYCNECYYLNRDNNCIYSKETKYINTPYKIEREYECAIPEIDNKNNDCVYYSLDSEYTIVPFIILLTLIAGIFVCLKII